MDWLVLVGIIFVTIVAWAVIDIFTSPGSVVVHFVEMLIGKVRGKKKENGKK